MRTSDGGAGFKDIGHVPDKFLDDFCVGHGVLLKECAHASVMFGDLSIVLSADDHVGIVDVGGVDVRVFVMLVDQPRLDDCIFFFGAPEILIGTKDLLERFRGRHGLKTFLGDVLYGMICERCFGMRRPRRCRGDDYDESNASESEDENQSQSDGGVKCRVARSVRPKGANLIKRGQ